VSPLALLPTVGLGELQATAALQTRRDRKYLLDPRQVETLLDELPATVRVLEIGGAREFGYESVYFDTPALASYLGAARRRPHRFKVRSRLYTESRLCQLEVKTRDRRRLTVKRRAGYDPRLHGVLTAPARDAVGRVPQVGALAAALAPRLVTRYRRSTLLQVDGTRVTLDRGVEFTVPDGDDGAWTGLGELTVVETKSLGRPTDVDRLLWRCGARPLTVSKYGTGLALLDPGLPATKWRRAMRRLG
jgi:hypothetical protein